MKKIKLIILGFASTSLLLSSSIDTFSLKPQEKIQNHTKIRSIETNINDRREFLEILNTFQDLERKLAGFEERIIINKLKNEFRSKYVVEEIDLINIYTNLNDYIKVK